MDRITEKIQFHQTYRPALRYVDNDRMAGRVAKWENIAVSEPAEGTRSTIEQTLSQGQLASASDAGAPSEFAQMLARQGYLKTPDAASSLPLAAGTEAEAFGLNDLVDMINPLHHIPLVKDVYEALSGDTIKPIGRLVGGAVFGGPIGAVVQLANVVSEEETGKTLGQNMLSAFDGGDEGNDTDVAYDDEDAQAVMAAFADLGHGADTSYVIEPEASDQADLPAQSPVRPRYAHETRHYNE